MSLNNAADCVTTKRWMDAANNEWYIVLRAFDGFEDCTMQPDSWHQQSINEENGGVEFVEGYSYNIAPGEWRGDQEEPEVGRMSGGDWCSNVRDMTDSGAPWQLIVSFNEWNAGTSVETSEEWVSESGYGIYMDCLNDSNSM